MINKFFSTGWRMAVFTLVMTILTACSKNDDGVTPVEEVSAVYPKEINLFADHLELTEKGSEVSFDFEVVPEDAEVDFVCDGDNANIMLVNGETALDSPQSATLNFRIVAVSAAVGDYGLVIPGRFTANVVCDTPDVEGEEIVNLLIVTQNDSDEPVYLYSEPLTVTYSTRPNIYGITINGIAAEKRDADTFYVKLPYGSSTSVPVAFSSNSTVYMGDSENPETVDLSNPVTLTATLDGMSREYSLVPYYSNLPIVFVKTPSEITSKDNWVKKSRIQIANAGELDAVYEEVQMKGRGNSTWWYPKRPYAIKLNKKAEVLGMPKHKRWCLLANWMDRTNIRNEIAFEIGRRLPGLAWTPKGRFVELVLNGKFSGNYYLCEQIKIDDNRVPVEEMTEADTEGDALTGGYLLELDTYFDEVNKFRTDILQLPVNLKDPDEDVLQPAQLDYIRDYFNNVEGKLAAHADYSEIEALIDVDSFIDWWLLQELTTNWEPCHPKSSYMYKGRNGKLFAGPAWDYDWGTFMGSNSWICKKAIWYDFLFSYPEFAARAKEKWSVNRELLSSIPDYIDQVKELIRESAVYDCMIWPINQTVNGDEQLPFGESVDRLKENFEQRYNWLDKNISKL